MSTTAPTEEPQYVERIKGMAPTGQASQSNKALVDQKHKHSNGGQGSEQVDLLKGEQFFNSDELLHGTQMMFGDPENLLKPTKAYNSEIGGLPQARESVAGWAQRNLGFDFASADNTFLYDDVGRTVLYDLVNFLNMRFNSVENKQAFMCHALANQKDFCPAVLVPRNSWGLTSKIFENAGFKVIEYDVDPDDISGSYERALNEAKKDHVVAASYFNFPHNATGLHLPQEENVKIKAIADAHNAEADYPMALGYDLPYISACPKNEDPSRGYVDMGMNGVFDPEEEDPETEYFVAVSGSKFLRRAQDGCSFMFTDRKSAASMRKFINANGHGMSFNRAQQLNIAYGLSEQHDPIWHEQFDADREKITANCGALKESFTAANSMDGPGVVPGGIGMIQLVRFKAEDYIGRVVTSFDGKSHVINDVEDLLEFMDNFNREGVVLVDGEDQSNDTFMLRFALAADPETFKEKIAQRAAHILEHVRNCPHIDDLEQSERMKFENARRVELDLAA